MSASIEELTWKLARFRIERNWEQFHTPRNLLLALVGEVGELSSMMQWKTDEEISQLLKFGSSKVEFEHELADILSYLLLLAEAMGVDLGIALESKIALNQERYPINKAYGRSDKYTELT